MIRIAVCVCTFRNPAGLKELFKGLDAQTTEQLPDHKLTIGVVDNDDGGVADEVLNWYRAHGRFPLEIRKQSRRGLSIARNTALELDCVQASDLFAFLDDDEIPVMDWLQTLVGAMADPQRAIVIGPVAPLFQKKPPEWMISGGFFYHGCSENEPHAGHTGNVIMRTSVIRKSGVRFDESLNNVGGEDVLFFRGLRSLGIQVHCAPRAVVHETIPPSRANLRWMMRRWLRTGASTSHLAGSSGLSRRIAAFGGGVARILGGSARLALQFMTNRDVAARVHVLSTVCRGAGMLLFACGRSYEEYGRRYRSTTSQAHAKS